MNYYEKYLKYKNKYLELKNLHGGMLRAGPQPHLQQGVFNQLPPPIPKPQLIVPQPQLQPTIKQEVPNCDNMYKELYEYAYDLKLDDLNKLLKKCPTIDINHIFEEKNNETALMIACNSRSSKNETNNYYIRQFVRRLIEHGAFKNIKNTNGWTPLMVTIIRENYDLIDDLLTGITSAQINQQNNEGKTALHFLAGRSETYTKKLLAHGADFNIKDSNGKTSIDALRDYYLGEVGRNFENSLQYKNDLALFNK
jgi:ankyrin repeat protein